MKPTIDDINAMFEEKSEHELSDRTIRTSTAARAAMLNPALRKNLSDKAKIRMADKAMRQLVSDGTKAAMTAEVKDKVARLTKEAMARPDVRVRMLEGHKKAMADPSTRIAMRQAKNTIPDMDLAAHYVLGIEFAATSIRVAAETLGILECRLRAYIKGGNSADLKNVKKADVNALRRKMLPKFNAMLKADANLKEQKLKDGKRKRAEWARENFDKQSQLFSKPCTIDGVIIYPSMSALKLALGQGKNGYKHPNFRYLPKGTKPTA